MAIVEISLCWAPMKIKKELAELLEANVITKGTADRISDYYAKNGNDSGNRLIIIFAVLGALLVGLGIILIVAHNWDELGKGMKTAFAFLPLLLGQGACAYALLKQERSSAWSEGGSTFLFVAIGACLSLISQIYNIEGELSGFLWTWLFLGLPIIYVMRSSTASILYIIGITYFVLVSGSRYTYFSNSNWYWLMIVLVLPYYIMLFKKKPASNFLNVHNWLMPISLSLALTTLGHGQYELMFVVYISLFGLFYVFGNSGFFKDKAVLKNSYRTLGSLGTMFLLFLLSFEWYWEDLGSVHYYDIGEEPAMYMAILVTLLAMTGAFIQQKIHGRKLLPPITYVHALFPALFFIGQESFIPIVVINLLVLGLGIANVNSGAKHNNLGFLNYGMVIICTLITCRFFDLDLPFVLKGVIFLLMGVGFFVLNIVVLKKRKSNE